MKKLMNTSERIKSIRQAMNIDEQKSFGDLLGVGQTTVSGYESGKFEPSSEIWAKLGNLVAYPDNIWCWGKAGMDEQALLSAAESILKERVALPAKGETVAIPRVRMTRGGMKETGVSISIPAERVDNLLSTSCLEVDKDAANPLLSLGDLVVFDKSETASPLLHPFWDQPLLVDIDLQARTIGGSPAAHVVGHISRTLCIGELRCERVGPPVEQLGAAQNLVYHATLVWHTEPKRTMTLDSHTRIVVGKWSKRVSDLPHGVGAEAYKQALNEMQPEPGCKVVGRVIAWFPQSKTKVKE